MKRTFLAGLLALLCAACGGPASTEPEGLNVKPAAFGNWGVDLPSAQAALNPGDDFHGYVNAAWFAANPVPPERSSWGSFSLIAEQSERRVRAIIKDLEGLEPVQGTPAQKVSDYMQSWMDVALLDQKGLAAVQPDLDRIAEIDSQAGLIREFGLAPLVGGNAPFFAYVGIDPINPDAHNLSLGLSGLGLPDRDYYFDDSARFAQIRGDYLQYIARMLNHAGYQAGAEVAQQVLDLEAEIAQLQWARADRRDRDKTYNPTTFNAFIAAYPSFAWADFFKARGIESAPSVNVVHPDTIGPLIDLVQNQPIAHWKAYLAFHMLDNHASLLTAEIDEAAFNFRGKQLSGQEERLTRWKRGVARVGSKQGLGELLGQIYVDQHFPSESKVQMEALVENLRTAFGQRILSLPWMGEDTKVEALKKLAAFEAKIGYPDQWKPLKEIEIDPGNLFGNARAIQQYFWQESVQDLNAPTDRAEWYMMPQTVNAYYTASFNQIVFPAAILEPPFFDSNADPAVNYGSIGAVIGHEMGHGFDDQGSKYDSRGVKRAWWTEADLARFAERTGKLASQFSAYESLPGYFIDGAFTLGENIGDLGGVEVAFHAYQLSLKGKPAPVIDGYTGEQRFFLAYAQAWRVHRRDDLALRLLKSDSHSPPKYRVNGILRNIDAWYEAFNVGPDNALWLPAEERVKIW